VEEPRQRPRSSTLFCRGQCWWGHVGCRGRR